MVPPRARHQAFERADAVADDLRACDPAHHAQARQSDAHRTPLIADGGRATPDWLISSLTAKRPTMTSTGSMPSSRSGRAEGEAGHAGHRIGADGRDHQPDDRGGQALEQRFAGQRGDDAEARECRGEIGRRREGEREARQRLGEQHQHGEPEQAADDAGPERDAERLAGAALPLHLVAVDHRRRGGVGAGRADQDGRDRAAIFGADIGAGEQHDRQRRVQRVGEGQQQRHGDRGRNAGQRAAEDAPDEAADRHRRRAASSSGSESAFRILPNVSRPRPDTAQKRGLRAGHAEEHDEEQPEERAPPMATTAAPARRAPS